MKKIVKKSAIIIGGVLAVLTVIAFLAWVNNLYIAFRWDPSQIKEESGKIIRPIYQGLISRLDWAVVDYSTVTTLIPFFGLLLMTIRCFQIANAKEGTNVSEYFPSFQHYEVITIALGLMGTVWGLIMIGYYNTETLTNPQLMMPELIRCMHTALYSTFVALFWVFAVVYPMKWIMPAAYRCVSDYRDPKSGENILSLLNNLGSATAEATKNIKAFNGQVVNVKNELKLKETGDFLKTFKEGKEKIVSEAKSLFKLWQESAEEQQKTGQQLQEILKSFSTELAGEKNLRIKAEKMADQAEKRAIQAEEVKKDLQKVGKFFQEFNLEKKIERK